MHKLVFQVAVLTQPAKVAYTYCICNALFYITNYVKNETKTLPNKNLVLQPYLPPECVTTVGSKCLN